MSPKSGFPTLPGGNRKSPQPCSPSDSFPLMLSEILLGPHGVSSCHIHELIHTPLVPLETGDLRSSLFPTPFPPDSLMHIQDFTCTNVPLCPSRWLGVGSPLPTPQLGNSCRGVSWGHFRTPLICSLSPRHH